MLLETTYEWKPSMLEMTNERRHYQSSVFTKRFDAEMREYRIRGVAWSL
jgi:hypothetical protein